MVFKSIAMLIIKSINVGVISFVVEVVTIAAKHGIVVMVTEVDVTAIIVIVITVIIVFVVDGITITTTTEYEATIKNPFTIGS